MTRGFLAPLLAVALVAPACSSSHANIRLAGVVTAGRVPDAIAFWNAGDGIVGGQQASPGAFPTRCSRRCSGFVAVTSNGGATWHVTLSYRLPFTAVDALPGTTLGWATAARCRRGRCNHAVFATTDRGRTWQRERWPVRDPVFASRLTGWALPGAVSNPQSFDITDDGGLTWQASASPCATRLGAVGALAFPSLDEGRVVCVWRFAGRVTQALYRLGFTGRWRLVSRLGGVGAMVSPAAPSTQGPSGLFVRGEEGWLWGTSGHLYRYRLGRGWSAFGPSRGSDVAVRSVWFVSRRRGYLIVYLSTENYATLLRTADGGLTWTPVHQWLQPISFCKRRFGHDACLRRRRGPGPLGPEKPVKPRVGLGRNG